MPDDEPSPAAFDSVVGRVEAQLSRGRPSGAVEAPAPASIAARPPALTGARGFATGVFTGIAALATAVQLWVAFELSGWKESLSGFGLPPPPATRLALSAGWRYGAPLVLVALIAIVHLGSRRKAWPMAIVAALALAVIVYTQAAARFPLYALGGQISGD